MTFKFRDDIPAMIGGREALLADVRQRLATTRRITNASDASNIPADDVRRHVVRVVLDTIVVRLHLPLAQLLEAHMASAVDDYRLFAGNPAGAADAAWFDGKHAALLEALDGEVSAILGPEALAAQIDLGAPASVIADAVLAQPIDTAKALAACSIMTDDIEALVAEVRTPPQRESEEPAFGLKDIAALVRAKLAAGGDPLELDQAVRDMFASETEASFLAASAVLTDQKPALAAIIAFLDTRDPGQADADADLVMTLATAERAVQPGAIPEARVVTDQQALLEDEERRRRPAGRPRAVVTPLTDVALAALEAMRQYSSMAETPLAESIGITRGIMNNYIRGRTAWMPTEAQLDTLAALLKKYADALAQASTNLEVARL